jgi:hypothetical protein
MGAKKAVLEWQRDNSDKILKIFISLLSGRQILKKIPLKMLFRMGSEPVGCNHWNPDSINYIKCLGKNSKVRNKESYEYDKFIILNF